MHDAAWLASRETAYIFSARREALAKTDQQILFARKSLRLKLADKERMIVGEIRVQAMHCLRHRNGKLFRQRYDLCVRSFHANLGTHNKHRILSFDQPLCGFLDQIGWSA